MSLYIDVEKMFRLFIGEDSALVLKGFGNPEQYPEDFMENCNFFLAKIIGKDEADEVLNPVFKKYVKGGK